MENLELKEFKSLAMDYKTLRAIVLLTCKANGISLRVKENNLVISPSDLTSVLEKKEAELFNQLEGQVDVNVAESMKGRYIEIEQQSPVIGRYNLLPVIKEIMRLDNKIKSMFDEYTGKKERFIREYGSGEDGIFASLFEL